MKKNIRFTAAVVLVLSLALLLALPVFADSTSAAPAPAQVGDRLPDDATSAPASRGLPILHDQEFEAKAKLSFWVYFVIFGALLPLVPLLIGLILVRKSSLRFPKIWYALVIPGGVWLLCSLGIFLLLLL